MDAAQRAQVQQRLEGIYARHLELGDAQRQVDRYYSSPRGYYPPAEAGPEANHFAICLVSVDGDIVTAGDADLPFALQSLSKVFAYGLALREQGSEAVLKRVGVKPSADAFTSLEYDEANHRPFNPMVNGGALAVADMLLDGDVEQSFEPILELLRACAGNHEIGPDEDVYAAEQQGADRNRAMAYLMRSEGMLEHDVIPTLSLYLRQCSVAVTCRDLAMMGATLANGCSNPITGESALPRRCARDVLSVMYTCGMYDFAGEWAYEVGVPAKSGVSGGILAVIPGKMGIAVYSPGLDRYGNSVRGITVCREISERRGLHVFATEAEESLLGATT
ncbi:MAG: glutaminase A [Solirubrobacterales bacterium]